MQKIVVDIYGADSGPAVVLGGVAKAIKQEKIFPILVGDSALITESMTAFGIADSQYEIIHTTDYITNNEPATVIFGGRDESTIALSYKRLKEDDDTIAFLSVPSAPPLII